jgi:hypothetical protein
LVIQELKEPLVIQGLKVIQEPLVIQELKGLLVLQELKVTLELRVV